MVTTWLLVSSLLGKRGDKVRNRQKKGEQGDGENDRERERERERERVPG